MLSFYEFEDVTSANLRLIFSSTSHEEILNNEFSCSSCIWLSEVLAVAGVCFYYELRYTLCERPWSLKWWENSLVTSATSPLKVINVWIVALTVGPMLFSDQQHWMNNICLIALAENTQTSWIFWSYSWAFDYATFTWPPSLFSNLKIIQIKKSLIW